MRPSLTRIALTAAVAALLAACLPRPVPSGDDTRPPEITLTALDGIRTPVFTTSDGAAAVEDACAIVRSFPARVSVSAVDESGLGSLVVSVFAGRVEDVSAAPSSAEVRVTRDDSRTTSVLTLTPRPPAGQMQPNVLVTFTVSELSAIVATATDTRGNHNELYQVDMRPPQSPVVCRET